MFPSATWIAEGLSLHRRAGDTHACTRELALATKVSRSQAAHWDRGGAEPKRQQLTTALCVYTWVFDVIIEIILARRSACENHALRRGSARVSAKTMCCSPAREEFWNGKGTRQNHAGEL